MITTCLLYTSPFGAMEILDNKIEINASCKMCKLCVKSCPVQAVSLVEDAVKQTVDKDAWKGVMVFVEQEESGIHPVAFELIGKARELAAKINHPVYAVLIGGGQAKEQAQTLLEYGVDKVYVYEMCIRDRTDTGFDETGAEL